jgi:ATP-binding protein involved in chromosome partitioning
MAVALKCRGYRVGLLDADITGPNIPKLMGIEPVDADIIKAVSIFLLLRTGALL